MHKTTVWKIITAIELVVAAAVILLDLFIPTLVILGIIALSLLLRRESIRSLGFKRPQSWSRTACIALAGAVSLQLFDIGVVMPILNRLTETTIDNSGFASLKGNPAQLLLLLVLSWTLAALGEETVYRGYLQKLLAELFGNRLPGILLMVGVSSLLFGFAHTQQGLIGVIVTTLDALFFSWLKLKCDGNLWVTILAHGFYNTLGILVVFFTGPITGLW